MFFHRLAALRGWAVIRDKTINKEYDASHILAPMPIAFHSDHAH